jgi:hypothetical protein
MTRRIMKSGFQAVVAVALLGFAALTRGDEPGSLELGVATGFTRGHGPAAGGMMPELQDLAGNGGALRLDVGWRLDRRWLAGTYFEVGRLGSGEQGTDGMTSVAAGIHGQLHLAPAARLDPWVGLGAGWRGLWLEHASGTHVLQGLDLARLELGLDYRVSEALAVAPTLGLAFTEMLSEKRPGASGYSDVQDRKIGHYLFAGVSGRFDVFAMAGGRP